MAETRIIGALDDRSTATVTRQLNQNPTYPADKDMTVAEMEEVARAASMQRAQSPNPLVCILDNDIVAETLGHNHTFDECMTFRHANVIGDQDPWTYWQLYDMANLPAPPPPPTPPPPLTGWQPRAHVNARGIAAMDGWSSGWVGWTFVTQIGPSQIKPLDGGSKARLTLMAACVFDGVYIGPASSTPFIAEWQQQLLFSGSTSALVDVTMDYMLVSDELAYDVTGQNGIIVSGYVTAIDPTSQGAWLATRGSEPDWYSRWTFGNYAHELDKTSPMYVHAPQASLGVLMVEGFF